MEVLMMLKRKIEKDIMRWIEGGDKALLIPEFATSCFYYF